MGLFIAFALFFFWAFKGLEDMIDLRLATILKLLAAGVGAFCVNRSIWSKIDRLPIPKGMKTTDEE